MAPSEWSPGRQRYYDDQAVQRLLLIKEMQAERLTLREITERLRLLEGAETPSALAARLRALEGELDRLNREVGRLVPQLEGAGSGAERRAVAQVASLALAKTLALAQWLATVVREGQAGTLA